MTSLATSLYLSEWKDMDGFSTCVHGRRRRSDAASKPVLQAVLVNRIKGNRNRQSKLKNVSSLLYNYSPWNLVL